MAFAFFRRRQKMVIIIMVVLMVAFLVGFQGFDRVMDGLTELLSPKGNVGTAFGGKVTVNHRDIVDASNQLKVLREGVLVRGVGGRSRAIDWIFGLMISQPLDEYEMGRAYTLMLAEANHMGVQVTADEVDSFLTDIDLDPQSPGYAQTVKDLGRSGKEMLRSSIANWLLVRKAAVAGSPHTPPSLPAVERLFAQVSERIDLRMAEISASTFKASIGDPTDAQVREFFEKYRSSVPQQFATCDSMGFGYYQPDRAALSYLLVSKDAVAKFVRVDPAEARAYYRRNESQFVKLVPVETPATQTTQPAATSPATATAPATANAPQSREVPKSLTEALPEIEARLVDLEAERQVGKVVEEIQLLLRSDARGAQTYPQVRQAMMLDDQAAGALAVKLPAVDITKRPLSEALTALASAAGLRAISYPLGLKSSDEQVLRGQAPVAVSGKDITLAEALDQIAQQLKAPKIEWTMCRALPGVLFAKGPGAADTFPIEASQTGMVDFKTLSADPVLGSAMTGIAGTGSSLAQVAATAAPFKRQGKVVPLVEVGRPGPEMYVTGSGGSVSGRLLWTLTGVEPAHEPKDLTPEIRKQVVEDWKTQQAYAVATERAKALAAQARQEGLEKAAASMKIETTHTEPFSRRLRFSYGGQTMIFPSRVPGIELPAMASQATAEECLEKLHSQVFALAPQNVNPPYPSNPAVAVLEVKPKHSVYVVQRVGYTPPQRAQFNAMSPELRRDLAQEQEVLAVREWFTYANLVVRTDFKPQEERLPVDNSAS